jgi:hypothetical protein
MAFAMLLAGCGGGGGSGSNPIIAAAANVQPVTVDAGPVNSVDLLFVTVTVCVPGTGNCQAIDHVQVDTGSSGLRIMASVLPSSFIPALPQQTVNGSPVGECAQFADGSSWGSVRLADVKLSGEVASRVPIQIIGDPYPAFAEPNQCLNTGPSENTVDTFGANGVIGVGEFIQDCGSACAAAGNNFYFACPCTAGSSDTGLPVNLQVTNPVALFANDNNGVIVELPSIPAAGQATVSGSLVFGIGTQPNNGLGSARVFKTAPDTGYLTTTSQGSTNTFSLFDSGSSAYFFTDSKIAQCNPSGVAPGYYCPAAPQNLSAIIKGADNASAVVGFSVANAEALFNNNLTYSAFNNIGYYVAPSQYGTFIWGLPAFFGRNVYTAIEGKTTSAGPGPYIAF